MPEIPQFQCILETMLYKYFMVFSKGIAKVNIFLKVPLANEVWKHYLPCFSTTDHSLQDQMFWKKSF